MSIRTPLGLGLVIREHRRKQKLTQSDLARRIGVGRQWIVAIERGKSRAEIGLVLRALNALDIPLTIERGAWRPQPGYDDLAPVDLNAVVAAAKGKRQ